MHRQPPKPQASGFLKQIRPGRNHQHRNLRPFPHSLAPLRSLPEPHRVGRTCHHIGPAPISMRMSADQIPEKYRLANFFGHIDMGFLNRRLAISALGPIRDDFLERQRPGEDHMTVLANDHLLVTMLIDLCTEIKVPTLAEALTLGKPKHLFMSIERLEPCPEIYEAERVKHAVHLDIDYGKPVNIAYHTSHVVSDTGRMTLA